jgi:hypothetical protein
MDDDTDPLRVRLKAEQRRCSGARPSLVVLVGQRGGLAVPVPLARLCSRGEERWQRRCAPPDFARKRRPDGTARQDRTQARPFMDLRACGESPPVAVYLGLGLVGGRASARADVSPAARRAKERTLTALGRRRWHCQSLLAATRSRPSRASVSAGGALFESGTLNSTRVPCEGVESMRIAPPASSTRSRMETRPRWPARRARLRGWKPTPSSQTLQVRTSSVSASLMRTWRAWAWRRTLERASLMVR